MAIDDGLAQRIREALDEETDVSERRMFGGLAFMLRGDMCVGVVGEELMVRVGPDGYERALREPHARQMDFTGRAMRGFVYVGADGLASDSELCGWVQRGVGFASSLPAK
jgi:TfoX/Sxy family transcriptional regulator of competence genes